MISMVFWFILNVGKFAGNWNEKRIYAAVGIIVSFALIELYVYIYMIKTPWYRTNFMPPNDYIKGPINRD